MTFVYGPVPSEVATPLRSRILAGSASRAAVDRTTAHGALALAPDLNKESAKKSGVKPLCALAPCVCGCDLNFWIPTAEYVVQILVEDPRPSLQQKMRPAQRPLHLLFFDESLLTT
jgi:hypothetical protein